MPFYKDCIYYISQIQDYISHTKTIINSSSIERKSLYISIAKEWKGLLNKYYTDFFFNRVGIMDFLGIGNSPMEVVL